jgi:methylmalonyl-CoA epimerase
MSLTPLQGTCKQRVRLNHVGIAVRSIDVARKFYEKLGLSIGYEEIIPHEQVRVAFLQAGERLLELLEPTEKDSSLERFLEKRGEGLHHLALEVPDIESTLQALKKNGVRLTEEVIRIGADGHRYFFIHPSSAGGILLEIVEATLPNARSSPEQSAG